MTKRPAPVPFHGDEAFTLYRDVAIGYDEKGLPATLPLPPGIHIGSSSGGGTNHDRAEVHGANYLRTDCVFLVRDPDFYHHYFPLHRDLRMSR